MNWPSGARAVRRAGPATAYLLTYQLAANATVWSGLQPKHIDRPRAGGARAPRILNGMAKRAPFAPDLLRVRRDIARRNFELPKSFTTCHSGGTAPAWPLTGGGTKASSGLSVGTQI
ncbi:hypothetical protein EVAR_11876_1 [Eumeta japonica]|uniref:Uncharacterized protein n=1 Tax=Eumeta variegata TaxID=151549 RepID=A0A4C1U8C9_EUMVA|nr:hypothetical protein EVAR_11876_1 [Eumeta japonica]